MVISKYHQNSQGHKGYFKSNSKKNRK